MQDLSTEEREEKYFSLPYSLPYFFLKVSSSEKSGLQNFCSFMQIFRCLFKEKCVLCKTPAIFSKALILPSDSQEHESYYQSSFSRHAFLSD